MHFLRLKRSCDSPSRSPRVVPEAKHGCIIDSASKSSSGSRGPKLERQNCIRHIDYDLEAALARISLYLESSHGEDVQDIVGTTRLLDLPSYGHQTSFRISGEGEREIEEICRSLGLSGPEEFSISLTEWEARKYQLSPASRLKSDSSNTSNGDSGPEGLVLQSAEEQKNKLDVEGDNLREVGIVFADEARNVERLTLYNGKENTGIGRVRPPFLVPPQPMASSSISSPNLNEKTPPLPLKPSSVLCSLALDRTMSTWDIVSSVAAIEEAELYESVNSDDGDEIPTAEVVGNVTEVIEELMELRLGETDEDFTGVSSYSTVNDDDSSSTTTEATLTISPKSPFKTKIKSWSRIALLGAGSYGTVHEAISEDGFFFAVKEVSLLDQGSNAQQCIDQLEQEITLLSQLEHENIVKYYGTDKEDTKLLIFLELVTKGSLASLYQKYHLRDSHVSAYTRQILSGLKYLHDRNVVHRDIKCTNILVHANGSVKLADFGLAKEMKQLTVLKSCKGSAYWMAPEVVNHRKTYGLSADIWSLGCTVLEMLTRQIPYPNVDWMQALYMIGQGEQPPIPSNLSRDARDFISQCVRVNPSDRPTAAELLDHPFVKRKILV